MRSFCFLSLLLIFFSCKESNKDRITRLLKEWESKEITFPNDIIFTRYGMDTLDYHLPESDYTIVSYIDSVGCTACRLQFHRWQNVMHEMDSVSGKSIPYLFVFHPKDKRNLSDLYYLSKRDKFDYPVWVDVEDVFNKQNQLPVENMFHSFLVDKRNKVVAIGDPFQIPKVRELYLNIISGNDEQKLSSQTHMTSASIDQPTIDLGEFDRKVPQKVVITLRNTGKERLVVHDIASSCGCISVDYPKTPVDRGKELSIHVTYKADEPGHISKQLTVYANIESPIRVTIKGQGN